MPCAPPSGSSKPSSPPAARSGAIRLIYVWARGPTPVPRKPNSTGVARARQPTLGAPMVRPGVRASASGAESFHFKHTRFKRSQSVKNGKRADPGRRQDYIDRPGAVAEFVDPATLDAAVPTVVRSSFGTIGDTEEERRQFWRLLEKHERDNGTVQLGVIAGLPRELSTAGRHEAVRRFTAEMFGASGLPFWAAIHLPDAKGDQRNHHAHILYGDRPCARMEDGRWDFEAGAQQRKSRSRYPWGVEKPTTREKRLRKQLKAALATLSRTTESLRAQIAEAQAFKDALRNNGRRGGPPKPWGNERPSQRIKRLTATLDRLPTAQEVARFRSGLAEIEEWRAQGSPISRAINPSSRNWVPHLRARFSEICNTLLQEEGAQQRLDPRSYKEMGIEATPTQKLGMKAAALEAQGIATAIGRTNAERVLSDVLSKDDGAAARIAEEAAIRAARNRAQWAALELAEAKARSDDRAVAYWLGEQEQARQAEAAVMAPRPIIAPEVITPDGARARLRLEPALPGLEVDQATNDAAPIIVQPQPDLLAKLKGSIIVQPQPAESADAPASTEPAINNTAAPDHRNDPPSAPKGISLPSEPTVAAPPTPLPGVAETVVPEPPSAAVVTLPVAADTPPPGMLFRLRPGADDADVAAAHARLAFLPVDALQRSVQVNLRAMEEGVSPHERTALRGGLSVLRDEIALRLEGQPSTERLARQRVKRWLAEMKATAEALSQTSVEVSRAMPETAGRVVEATRRSGRPIEQEASLLGGAFTRERNRSPAAAGLADTLADQLQRLGEQARSLNRAAIEAGGLTQSERAFLAILRSNTYAAVRWLPPDGAGGILPVDLVKDRLNPSIHPASPIMDLAVPPRRGTNGPTTEERRKRALELESRRAQAAIDSGRSPTSLRALPPPRRDEP